MDFDKQTREIIRGIEYAAVVKDADWLKEYINAQVQLIFYYGLLEEQRRGFGVLKAPLDGDKCKGCEKDEVERDGLCDDCAHAATLCECGKALEEGSEAGDFCPSCR